MRSTKTALKQWSRQEGNNISFDKFLMSDLPEKKTSRKKVKIEEKRNKNIIEIMEDIRIPNSNMILEKGDKIQVLKETAEKEIVKSLKDLEQYLSRIKGKHKHLTQPFRNFVEQMGVEVIDDGVELFSLELTSSNYQYGVSFHANFPYRVDLFSPHTGTHFKIYLEDLDITSVELYDAYAFIYAGETELTYKR